MYIYLCFNIVVCRPVARQATTQQLLLSNGSANKHVCMATVFSVRSVSIWCKQDIWSSELLVRELPASKNMSTEADNIVGIHHQAKAGEDITN